MSKLNLQNLSSLQNEQSAINIINANNDAIETAVEKTLSRDGTAPNQMASELDMNSNRVLNLPTPLTDNEPVRLTDLTAVAFPTGSDGNVVGPNSAVSGNLPSFAGSSGKIILDSGVAVTTIATKAPINSPTFTGVVSAPSISVSGNSSVGGNSTVAGTLGVTGVATFSATPVFPSNSIANGSLGTMTADTVKGRLSSTGSPQDLSKTQLTSLINTATSSLSGAVPASGGGTTNFLRADLSWSPTPPVTKVLLNTLTAAATSVLQDTTSFTSTYSKYEIEFVDIIPASASQTFKLEVHSGGSFVSTSYVGTGAFYDSSGVAYASPSTFIQLNGTSKGTTTIGYNGVFTVCNPSVTTRPKVWNGLFSQGMSGDCATGTFGGYWSNNAALTGFRVFFNSGAITSGQIKIYGLL